MLVCKWMTKDPVTVRPDESMQDVINRSHDKKLKFFPVVEEGNLIGVVTDTDLDKASPSKANILNMHELFYLASKIKVRDIMTKEIHSIKDTHTLEEVVWTMMEKRLSGMPVVDDQRTLVGVITRHDIFKAFAMFSGTGHNRGVELAVRAEQEIGKFKEVRDIIADHGGRIGSVMSSIQNAPERMLNIYIRLAIDRSQLPALQAALDRTFTVLYAVDYENDERLIC